MVETIESASFKNKSPRNRHEKTDRTWGRFPVGFFSKIFKKSTVLESKWAHERVEIDCLYVVNLFFLIALSLANVFLSKK